MMRKKNILQGEKARDSLNYSSSGYMPRLSSKGFTLIEILIAMVIFSVGILGVAKMQIAGINGNATARGVTDIVVQATDQIELLMLLPYDHADLTQGAHAGVALPGYTLGWVVDPDTNAVDINGDGTNDIVQIIVTVTDSRGRFRTLSFTKANGV